MVLSIELFARISRNVCNRDDLLQNRYPEETRLKTIKAQGQQENVSPTVGQENSQHLLLTANIPEKITTFAATYKTKTSRQGTGSAGTATRQATRAAT